MPCSRVVYRVPGEPPAPRIPILEEVDLVVKVTMHMSDQERETLFKHVENENLSRVLGFVLEYSPYSVSYITQVHPTK